MKTNTLMRFFKKFPRLLTFTGLLSMTLTGFSQPVNDCIFSAIDVTAQINSINPVSNPFACATYTYSAAGLQPTRDNANGNSTACDAGPDFRDVWFKFTITTSTPAAWLDVYQATGTAPDYVSALYSGTPGGTCGTAGNITGLTLIECSDGQSPGGALDVGACTTPLHPRINISTLAPGTYYYRVWEWGGGVPPNGILNLCAETAQPVGVTSDRCPTGATVAFGCGTSSNVNVSATYQNQSNSGCLGNACNTQTNEPQLAAGGAGQIRNNCTGGWVTSVVYVNNVMNNSAIYAFDVNSSGTCQANVTVKFDNITYAGTTGNVMQVQVMNAPCGGGTSAVMAGTTSASCFEMRSASGTLPNGTYYIVVDGQDGQLMKYDLSVDITHTGVGCTPTSPPPAPTAVNGTRCGNGTVNLSVSGCSGTANWYPSATSTVSVNSGATYTTPSLTASTTYYVSCTVSGCEGPRTTVTASVIPSPTVTASAAASTLCAGQSTTLTAGGAGSYTWSANAGSATTSTVSVTPPTGTTIYTVTGTSAGCTNTSTVSVTVNALPTVTASAASPTICAGQNTTLTAGGASTYVWSANAGSATTSTVSVSPGAGTTVYTVTGTSSGCSNTNTVAVTVTALPNVTATATSPTLCAGQNTTLTASGASTYTWSANAGSATTSTVSVSPGAGTTVYTVTGTGSGCSNTNTVAVTVTALPNVTAVASSSTLCDGQNTTLTAGGASTYTWSANAGSATTSTVSVSPIVGTTVYTVTGVSGGCSNTNTVSVTVNALPDASATTSGTISCGGGTATVNASSTTPGVTYSWSGPSITAGGTTATATVNLQGVYTVTVTDPSTGCANTATTSVSTSTAVPNATASTTGTLTCSNNSAVITGNSTTGGVTVQWNGPGGFSSTSLSNTVTTSGTYTFTVTDPGSGCTNVALTSVTTNTTPPTAGASTTGTLTCSSNTVVVNGSSTSSGVTYSWSGPGGFSSTNQNDIANTAGIYTVTVTDPVNGCVATATTSVSFNGTLPDASATTTSTITCTSSTTTVNGNSTTPGVTYNWSGPGIVSGAGSATATVNASGIYTLTVTDPGNGCVNTATTSVISNTSAPNASAATGGNITCLTGTTNVTGSSTTSGVTYTWNGAGIVSGANTATATVNAAGVYTVTVTDPANGCTNTATTSVTTNTTLPDISATTNGTITCGGGNATVTGTSTTPGVTYTWTGPGIVSGAGTATATVNMAGVYTVTVTDPTNGCSNSDTTGVTNSSNIPNAGASVTGTITCVNNAVTLNGSSSTAGVTYSWSGPGGYTSSSQNPVVNVAGSYTLTVTDPGNGCSNMVTTNVTTNTTVPNASASSGGTLTCTNNSTTVTASSSTSGVSYNWSGTGIVSGGGTPTATVNAQGNYTVTVTDPANGCTNTTVASVSTNTTAPDAAASASGTIGCSGGNATVTGTSITGGATFSWSGPGIVSGASSATATVNMAGTYTVTVTDPVNGCTNTATANVATSTGVPNATAGTTGTITCANSNATINGSSTTPGVTFSWSGPGGFSSTNQNPSVTNSGTYTLTVTDPGNGCINVVTTIVSADTTAPDAVASSTGTITCTSNTVTLSGTSTTTGVTYNWNGPGGFTSANQTATGNSAGTYTVTVTDPANGCTSNASVTVASNTNPPVIGAGPNITIDYGASATLNASGGLSYTWSPVDDLSCVNCASPVANPSVTTTYCVKGTDANGCSDSSCVKVTVDSPCGEIFVPTAFSPNGDKQNDLECVFGNCIVSLEFSIYDRWGEKVFEATNSKQCWDGTFRGEKLNTAVFAYFMRATLSSGKIITQKGNISLIR